MTDVSTVKHTDSSNVTPTDNDYESFVDQLRVLDQDQYMIIAFGNDAFHELELSIGTQVTTKRESEPVSLRTFSATIADRPVDVYGVYHYTNPYDNSYIETLGRQLAYIGGVLAE